MTPEQVIENMRSMIEIEQKVLAGFIVDCPELTDFPALADTIFQRWQVNSVSLLNLTLSLRQVKMQVEGEIADTESKLLG